MNYVKSLFFNFLIVFFANHVLPGIETVSQAKLPHLGSDLLFAFCLGFLNSLIYPLLKFTTKTARIPHIALAALVLNFVSYAILKLLPIGIHITSLQGYFLGVVVVSAGSFFLNFFEMKAHPPATSISPPNEPPKFI